MQDRYEFLKRAGLYQHPSMKLKGPSVDAFPLINEVIETNLQTFIKEVAGNGFKIEDYKLFRELMLEEFDEEDEKEWYLENGFEDDDEIYEESGDQEKDRS